jgi:hypothetical protein
LVVLLVALSLGNHAATVLLIPACMWLVLASAPYELTRPKNWLVMIGMFVVGITIYLLIPLRFSSSPAFNYAGTYDEWGRFIPVNLGSANGLWWLVSGKSFSGQMFAYSLSEFWQETIGFGVQLWAAFFAIGVGPGLLGLLILLRRDWRIGVFLTLLFGANAFFYINYRVVDKNTMYLPAYLVWALWTGVGFQTILNWIRNERLNRSGRYLTRFVKGFIIIVVITSAIWNWGRVDLSDDWSTRNRGEQILEDVEPNALVFGWWDTVPVIEYIQLVEGRRPDVQAINRFLISGENMERLIKREIDSRPVYINNPPATLLDTYGVVLEGNVYRLLPGETSSFVSN